MPPPPRHHAVAPPRAKIELPLLLPMMVLLLLVFIQAAAAQPDSSKNNSGGGGSSRYGPNQPPGFSAPMVVLLVALIVGFFFIGFFSVYMRRCGREASSGPTIPAAALLALSRQHQRQQQRGLDPAVVASFPTMRYAEARELRVGGKDAALECAVCLSEFEDDEELRLLPGCSHAFHPDCIGEWLAGHVTCPVCRCSLDPEELAAAEANGSGAETPQDQVAVDVEPAAGEEEEQRRREAMEMERIGSQRRALRSQSGRPLPRAHSTGHSLAAQLDGDLERFTLRLPEHMRRGMVAVTAAAGEESLRRPGPGRESEARGAGTRSARLGWSDRWPSSFLGRTISSRVPFWAASRRAPDADAVEGPAATARTKRAKTAAAADGSLTPGKGSVRFDCLGGGGANGGAVSGARVGAAAGDSDTEDEEKAIARRV